MKRQRRAQIQGRAVERRSFTVRQTWVQIFTHVVDLLYDSEQETFLLLSSVSPSAKRVPWQHSSGRMLWELWRGDCA